MKFCSLFLSLAAACAATAFAAPKPNIILLLSDDHSAPYLGCYGYDAVKTPVLDALASGGMKFRHMFTGAPQCVPSRATIMTGRSPVAARITRFSSPLAREEITFPEVLRKEAGYFVGVMGRTYHLDGSGKGGSGPVLEAHGLKTFPDRFNFVHSGSQDDLPVKLREFFDQRPANQPYFAWVNFNDPHHPWNTGEHPPAPASLKVPGALPDLPGVRESLSKYLGEIEHVDGLVKNVLEIVKERAGLENTLILFMGDNGMAFPGGKGSLYDPGLNVPLIASWPGVVKPGGDSDILVSGEDIGPTCLEAAGVGVPSRMSGVSFMPALQGVAFEGRKHVFAERGPHGSAPFNEHTVSSAVDYSRMARSAQYKLIYNVTPNLKYSPVDCGGDPVWQDMLKANEDKQLASEFVDRYFTSPRPVLELYDLTADPAELHNLAGDPKLAVVENDLKRALMEKMVLDFDYLPLPEVGDDGAKKNGRKSAANEDTAREKMFAEKDTDKNGTLSREEFGKGRSAADAENWFKARDVNNDGVLSHEEFLAHTVRNPPKR